MARKSKAEHYLITISNGAEGKYIHGYLMTNDKADIDNVLNTMVECMEGVVVPIALVTGPLKPETVEEIRGMLSDDPEVKKTLDASTDFHVTVWEALCAEDNERLLEIH